MAGYKISISTYDNKYEYIYVLMYLYIFSKLYGVNISILKSDQSRNWRMTQHGKDENNSPQQIWGKNMASQEI